MRIRATQRFTQRTQSYIKCVHYYHNLRDLCANHCEGRRPLCGLCLLKIMHFIRQQILRYLHGISSSAFTQVVCHYPHVQCFWLRFIFRRERAEIRAIADRAGIKPE